MHNTTRCPPVSPTTSPDYGGKFDLSFTSGRGGVQSFLPNPNYFMFASLAKPDDDVELHWLKNGKTRCTKGSVVSSLYNLKDTKHNNKEAGFFVFPDLSVRIEGSYRLKLSLFKVVGNKVQHCRSIYSASFYVYTAKKFLGMEESTPLPCSLADQRIKICILKDIRVRKKPIHALELPLPNQGSMSNREGPVDPTLAPAGPVRVGSIAPPPAPVPLNTKLTGPVNSNQMVEGGGFEHWGQGHGGYMPHTYEQQQHPQHPPPPPH